MARARCAGGQHYLMNERLQQGQNADSDKAMQRRRWRASQWSDVRCLGEAGRAQVQNWRKEMLDFGHWALAWIDPQKLRFATARGVSEHVIW